LNTMRPFKKKGLGFVCNPNLCCTNHDNFWQFVFGPAAISNKLMLP
jgi:hypothetical protein